MKDIFLHTIVAFLTLTLAIETANAAPALGHVPDNTKTEKKKKKQNDIMLYGEAMDSFTKARLKAHVTLMLTDSTVVDTTTCWIWRTSSSFAFEVPKEDKDYILKAEADGYETAFVNYAFRHKGRKAYYELPGINMRKKAADVYKNVDLDGVEIKGTRVQVVYKGDTIVYDAAAFNVPEGSMLDALVRQLPGAEIKDGGDIYINGRKIDYLTLNGKDFFKGENKVMLDNLPYFTVKNVQVYHKSSKQSRQMGHEVEKKDYVMDVVLKRQYARGYIANAEVGGGTEQRWLAKLFGLYYDDHNRVAVFGNANNVNEDRRPGEKGDWSPKKQQRGLMKMRQAGLNVQTEDKDQKLQSNLDAVLKWNDSSRDTRTSTERFATGGNIFGGSMSSSMSDDFSFSLTENLDINTWDLYLTAYIDYSRSRTNTFSADSSYTANGTTTRSTTLTHGADEGTILRFTAFKSVKLPWGDALGLGLTTSYNQIKPNDSFGRTVTSYVAADSSDLRNTYGDNRSRGYKFAPWATYSFVLPKSWRAMFSFAYSQAFSSAHNELYRLDRLKGFGGGFGSLPSTRDSLLLATDVPNSHTHSTMLRTYQGTFILYKYKNGIYHRLELPLKRVVERMRYAGCGLDTVARRSYTAFSPTIQWMKDEGATRHVSYEMEVDVPEFTRLMPTSNTANPLAVYIANPDLKKRITHKLNAHYTIKADSTDRSLALWLAYAYTDNAWGTRATYNSATGVYTYADDNVDGNWEGSFNASLNGSIDKAKRFRYDCSLRASYDHSVDFAVVRDEQQDQLSKVNTIGTGAEANLSYKQGELSASVVGKLSTRHSRSKREDFTNLDMFDYQYGATLQYTVPLLKLNLSTDINMFSRRGYQSEVMNTDDLVWNAQLARSFLKGKLTAKLTAYDILHNLSNKQYSVDAQGRTETWTNSIPRYLMFSLAYKFDKTPKK